jgi:6-O-methylguanine DNA methyltransferase, DNA binding domain
MSATAQDVGEACAANALAVIVPCHRVVRTDRSLAGYRWGINRKRVLLQKEQEASPEHGTLFHLDPAALPGQIIARKTVDHGVVFEPICSGIEH